jgi:hypothetical protein
LIKSHGVISVFSQEHKPSSCDHRSSAVTEKVEFTGSHHQSDKKGEDKSRKTQSSRWSRKNWRKPSVSSGELSPKTTKDSEEDSGRRKDQRPDVKSVLGASTPGIIAAIKARQATGVVLPEDTAILAQLKLAEVQSDFRLRKEKNK